MATGFIASNGSDLDALFKPLQSLPTGNVNYRSNGNVDLSQRFQPRGTSTPIANTGFVSGAVDLAQIFMDINAVISDRTLVAGQTVGPIYGYDNGTMNAASNFGSLSNQNWNGYICNRFIYDTVAPSARIAFINFGSFPPNTNAVFTNCSVTGIFANSGGVSVTRVITRSTSTTGTSGPSGGNWYERYWLFPTSTAPFILGNSYGLLFT